MNHAEIQATTPFAGEFESFEGELESEAGRRLGAMRTRPPMRARPPMRRPVRPRRVQPPRRRPRPRPYPGPRPQPWPAWPPYAGAYPVPLAVDGPAAIGSGAVGGASDPDRLRCVEQCMSGSRNQHASPEPPSTGGDAGLGTPDPEPPARGRRRTHPLARSPHPRSSSSHHRSTSGAPSTKANRSSSHRPTCVLRVVAAAAVARRGVAAGRRGFTSTSMPRAKC